VLRQDRWIARDVLAEGPREHARIGIIAAARSEADEERDRLAAVEFSDAVGRSRRRCRREYRRRRQTNNRRDQPTHATAFAMMRAVSSKWRQSSGSIGLGAPK